jgi:hypothetical protein
MSRSLLNLLPKIAHPALSAEDEKTCQTPSGRDAGDVARTLCGTPHDDWTPPGGWLRHGAPLFMRARLCQARIV